jgi:hypothetical protein
MKISYQSHTLPTPHRQDIRDHEKGDQPGAELHCELGIAALEVKNSAKLQASKA